jgi:PadR family transcriptional regulator PadR
MGAHIGEFEQIVLLAILRLDSGATGAAIRATVAEGGLRTVWIGAVHTTLERLEAKGLVRSSVAALPSVRGGSARSTASSPQVTRRLRMFIRRGSE